MVQRIERWEQEAQWAEFTLPESNPRSIRIQRRINNTSWQEKLRNQSLYLKVSVLWENISGT
jgi:hypothetical protein